MRIPTINQHAAGWRQVLRDLRSVFCHRLFLLLLAIGIAELAGAALWYRAVMSNREVLSIRNHGSVVLRAAPVVPATWAQLPQSLQDEISSAWPCGASGDEIGSPKQQLTQANRILMSEGNYAKVSLSCLAQFTTPTEVFVQDDIGWRHIGDLEFKYGCELAKLYDIPAGIVGDRCGDRTDTLRAVSAGPS